MPHSYQHTHQRMAVGALPVAHLKADIHLISHVGVDETVARSIVDAVLILVWIVGSDILQILQQVGTRLILRIGRAESMGEVVYFSLRIGIAHLQRFRLPRPLYALCRIIKAVPGLGLRCHDGQHRDSKHNQDSSHCDCCFFVVINCYSTSGGSRSHLQGKVSTFSANGKQHSAI